MTHDSNPVQANTPDTNAQTPVETAISGFAALGLPKFMLATLKDIKFDIPTPIQSEAIPFIMQGRDILGSAATGTGKTGAFGIPLITQLMESDDKTALILTPTRELATQVLATLKLMVRNTPIKTALLIGGEAMPRQLQQLRTHPRIVVGTPGRVNDHLKRGTLRLDRTQFLVLDETDRMLDMGFGVQIDAVLEHMPGQRQTLLFSATLPKAIVKLASKYLTNPVRVSVGTQDAPAANIQHDVIFVNDGEKYTKLTEQLNIRTGSVIIFVKTKHGADKLADKLSRDAHEATAIHGDLRQNKRDRVIKDFRAMKYRILVATDVAARGLDIPHIEHVVNYDLPQCAEDYIHRIGRTARAGAEGAALALVSSAEKGQWRVIQRMMDPNAKIANDDAPVRDYARKSSRNGGSRKPFGQNGGPRKSGGGYKGAKPGGFGGSSNYSNGGGQSRDGQTRNGPARDGQAPKRDFRSRDGQKSDGPKQGGERQFVQRRSNRAA